MKGVVHSDYGLYTAESAQHGADGFALIAQLLRIAYIQLAAAAFFVYRAGEFLIHGWASFLEYYQLIIYQPVKLRKIKGTLSLFTFRQMGSNSVDFTKH